MNKKTTIRKKIGEKVKELFIILKTKRITAKKPFVLERNVQIYQVVDGRGLLDFEYVTVKKIWHDRNTVVVETINGDIIRLIDSYETSGHYYLDCCWNIKELQGEIQKQLVMAI